MFVCRGCHQAHLTGIDMEIACGCSGLNGAWCVQGNPGRPDLNESESFISELPSERAIDVPACNLRRREFIGAAAGAAAVVSGAPARSQASPADEELVIQHPADALLDVEVRYRGEAWRIPRKAFGEAAKLHIDDKDAGQRYVRVKDAQWRDGARFQLEFEFAAATEGWTIALRSQRWPVAGTTRFNAVGLAKWLADTEQLRTNLSSAAACEALKSVLGATMQCRSPMALGIGRPLIWSGAAVGKPMTTLLGPRAEVREVRFRRLQQAQATPDSPATSATRTVEAQPLQATVASAEGLPLPGAQAQTVWTRKDARIWVQHASRLELTWTAPDRREAPLSLEVRGEALLGIREGREDEGPIRSPASTLTFHQTATELRASLSHPLPPQPQRCRSRKAQLVISGGCKPTCEPCGVLMVEAKQGVLQRFGGAVRLHQASVKLAGSDFDALRFPGEEGEPALVRLHGVPPPECPSLESEVVFGSRASLRLGLNRAEVEAARALDLMHLRFRFHGLTLLVDSGVPVIVRSAPAVAPASAGAASPSAVMTVELPPQHVAERAYFRALDASGKAGRQEVVFLPNVVLDLDRAVAAELLREDPNRKDEAVRFEPDNAAHWRLVEGLKDRIDPFYRAFRAEFAQRPNLTKFGWDIGNGSKEYIGGRDLLDRFSESELADYHREARELLRALQQKMDTSGEPEALEEVAGARLSGPSRVSFRVPDSAEAGQTVFDYTLRDLTDWSDLDLNVQRRAEAVTARQLAQHPDWKNKVQAQKTSDLAAALHYQFQDLTTTTAAGRLVDIVGTLKAPKPHETAIELPFRLHLSPAQTARWRVSNAPAPREDGSSGVPLWQMTLHEPTGHSTVRAIWSDDFQATAYLPPSDAKRGKVPRRGAQAPWLQHSSDPSLANRPFRTSMDAYDRHEIVGLSSIHGLPVLPRVLPSGQLDSHQLEPPEEFRLTDADIGADRQAIYLPRALNVHELSLSCLGGSLNLDTSFEPPAALRIGRKEPMFDAFSLERWRHRAVLGRDIEVEVVYKGFLFPLGVRCSLVKLTERRFLGNPVGGHPTAYLVQRMFLRIGRPDKTFPALGQPDGGRRWPAEHLRVLTRRTPDILDATSPSSIPSEAQLSARAHTDRTGRLRLRQQDRGLMFWPRASDGQDIRFEVQIDDSAGSVLFPLIFADNTAVKDEKTLEALAAYYNQLGTERPTNSREDGRATDRSRQQSLLLRTVNHGGARRRYAPESASGQNTHTTHRWKLSVEGRSLQNPAAGQAGGNAYFVTDPVLEGADQPPFYPVLEEAELSLSQVERFSGASVSPVRARYASGYVASGFDPGANRTSVYLDLIDHVPMCFSGQGATNGRLYAPNGHRSGGVAQPESVQNAVSADNGPVSVTYEANQVPRFDPKDFFSSNAKILGFVDLRTVLEDFVAPKLEEQVEYSVAGSLRQVACGDLLSAVRQAVEQLVREVDRANDRIKSHGQTVQSGAVLLQLYPDVGQAAMACRAAVGEATAACAPGGDEKLPRALSGVYETGRRLTAALSRASRDPLAPVREELRKVIRQHQLNLTGDVGLQLESALPGEAGKLVLAQVAELLSHERFENWRRLVFAYPLPPQNIGLDDIAAAIDGWMAQEFAALRKEGGPGRFEDLSRQATQKVKDRVLARIKQASELHPKAADALEAYRARVQADWIGPLLPHALKAVSQLHDATSGLMSLLQGRAAWAVADVHAALEGIRGQQRACEDALQTLLEAALPGDVNVVPKELCEEGATLLQNALLAMCFDSSDPVLNACRADGVDSRIEVRKALKGDAVRTRLEQVKEESAKAWIARLEAQLTAIVNQLSTIWQRLCREADEVTQVRKAFTSDDPWAKSACKPVAREALSLLPRLETARRSVLTSAREALDGLSKGTGALVAVLSSAPASEDLPAALVEDVWRECARALGRTMLTVLPWIGQASLIGGGAGEAAGLWHWGEDKSRRAELDRLLKGLQRLAGRYPGSSLGQAATKVLEELRASDRGISAIASQYKSALQALTSSASSRMIPAQLTQQIIDSAAKVEMLAANTSTIEQSVQHLLARTLMAQADVAERLVRFGWQMVAPVLKGAEVIDAALLAAWENLKAHIPKGKELGPLEAFLAKLLGRPFVEGSPLHRAAEALEKEKQQLQSINSLAAPVSLQDFADRLSRARKILVQLRDDAAAVRLVRGVETLTHTVLSGDLANLVDLDAPRRMLEDQLKQLVPTRISTRYEFGADIAKSVAGGLFQVEEARSATGKAEQKHLYLEAETAISLSAPVPKVKMRGRMAPFRLRLLPKFHVADLHFSPTTFRSDNGSAPTFDMKVKSVDLGENVQFLKALQSFLSPQGDDGFYLQMLPGMTGIEAGYSVNLGIISFGTLSFINVSLGVGCLLRFDDGKPLFTASLARRDSPFLISVAPYGGGGYVGLQSDGNKVTAFDLSFEYGGVGAFKFGPLQGQGRITTGLFIRSAADEFHMEGLFYCGGSAQVACFGIAASLAVRMAQGEGGAMKGQATFSYSFSVGLAKVRFKVNVGRQVDKPKSKEEPKPTEGQVTSLHFDAQPTVRTADARGAPASFKTVAYKQGTIDGADRLHGSLACAPGDQYGAVLSSSAVCQASNWRQYREYFDTSLTQEV
ncbi:MAG: hypothetical protein O9343_02800 [Burkholderiaceae bacterium]|nr:hypothetical protein [Burkholderiaceae bacterium]